MLNTHLKHLLAIAAILGCSCNPSSSSTGTNEKNTHATDTFNTPSAAANTSRGKELFQQRCIACHGQSGSSRNNNAADLSLNLLDSIGIVNTIINGKGAMPMFDHSMPDSDIAQLELYVKTLRK